MQAGEGRVCPYCLGKGYISVEVHPDDATGSCDTKTWVRKDCPLCEGAGVLYGGKESSESKDSVD